MRIVFFGTPDYTTSYLDLLDKEHEVVAVVTSPDKPAGRGRAIKHPGPALWAKERSLPCFQPEKNSPIKLADELASLNPDLGVVIAYGRILPKEVFTLPRLETVNLHFSLLPQFRGASPIEAALLCGSTKTGVSLQRLSEKLDAGDLIDSEPVVIAREDHFPDLFSKLFEAGRVLLERGLRALKDNRADFTPQSEPEQADCKKIGADLRRLDWQLPLNEVYNRIRAYSGKRTAWTNLKGKKLLIHRARLAPEQVQRDQERPGTIISTSDRRLFIVCGDRQVLELTVIQAENRQKMAVKDCLNGLRLDQNDCLE